MLTSLNVLYSESDPCLNAAVAITAMALDVPTCLVSLLGCDMQWFAAKFHAQLNETPRDYAFCNYPVARGAPFIVSDTHADERFKSNPLVVAAPRIRSYAGAPIIVANEFSIGALCVVDTEPRTFTTEQIQLLEQMAQLIATAIEQKSKLKHKDNILETQARLIKKVSLQREQMQRQISLFSRASRLAKLGAWQLLPNSDCIIWSNGMYELHEVDPKIFVPTRDSVLSFFSPAVQRQITTLIETSRANLGEYEIEVPMTCGSGTRKWIRMSGQYEATPSGVLGTGVRQDITEQKKLSTRTKRLAERDTLTGLHNRFAFIEELKKTACNASKSGESTAVCIVDLDDFKQINDLYGHDLGDTCLRKIAREMKRHCKPDIVIGRLGGDEFGIIVTNKTPFEIRVEILGPLLNSIKKRLYVKDHTFLMSGSVGISYRDGTDRKFTVEAMLKEADLAMYVAKRAGKNAVRLFEPHFMDWVKKREQALCTIRDAVENDRIEFHFQPKVEFSCARINGFEALVRCRTPDGSVTGPASFQAALDDVQLSEEIGNIAIEKCLRQAREWDDLGFDFGHIAINLSPSQFRDTDLPYRLFEGMRKYKIKPSMIQVEITEGVLLGGAEQATNVSTVLKALRQAGIRIAFDDFGTGFASLTHLLDFPVDCIKIDRSFVSGVNDNPRGQSIIKAIISLATSGSLNMDVIAEGIENERELDFIKRTGCKYGQGYYFSRPLPARDATTLLEACSGKQRPSCIITSMQALNSPVNG